MTQFATAHHFRVCRSLRRIGAGEHALLATSFDLCPQITSLPLMRSAKRPVVTPTP